jgi:hypothetical protein
VYAAIKVGLVDALHDVFLLGAALSLLGVVTVVFLQERPLRKSFGPPHEAEPASESTAQVGKGAFPSLPALRPEDQPAPRTPRPLPVSSSTSPRSPRDRAAG